jgi:glycosyltransferase involved in cell wall biosynthesis
VKKKRVCLFYLDYSTFVKEDDRIFSSEFDLTKYRFVTSKKLNLFIYQFIKQFWFLSINIRKFDVIYCWFSDYHSFLPMLFGKIFSKKNIIIVGGYDAVALPEINYGVFQKKDIRSFLARLSFRFANLIIPVDESLIYSDNNFTNKNGIKLGVKHFVKNLKAKFVVVPTGYDYQKWKRRNTPKKNIVLTVASIPDSKTIVLKGVDLFIEISKIMNSIEFIIIGVKDNMFPALNKIIGNNVKLIGFATSEELLKYYSEAKVFCQLSVSEGLPNTLCEAMLCECIPVGSNVGGIPTAIAEHGFILQNKDINEAKKVIKKALDAPEQFGLEARQHIINNFGIEKRKNSLFNLLS